MISPAIVDSALSGKKLELSFSCTVEIFEKAAPENPPIASHEMIEITAIQRAFRPLT
jgi:putative ubiquitin-RnfH superfamily antitoxin RatB of RatAB toxin-antitoxin module